MTGNTALLVAYGHHQFNSVRTIQQAWQHLNSTPYDVSKADKYRQLRQMMLRIQEKGRQS